MLSCAKNSSTKTDPPNLLSHVTGALSSCGAGCSISFVCLPEMFCRFYAFDCTSAFFWIFLPSTLQKRNQAAACLFSVGTTLPLHSVRTDLGRERRGRTVFTSLSTQPQGDRGIGKSQCSPGRPTSVSLCLVVA